MVTNEYSLKALDMVGLTSGIPNIIVTADYKMRIDYNTNYN